MPAGWNERFGEAKTEHISEDRLWALTNYFFSPACKKTSTYKFGFFKAIIDSLFSGYTSERGYEISYDVLFYKFAANYWNLVRRYHLHQMSFVGTTRTSKLETIINNAVITDRTLGQLEFDSVRDKDKIEIVNEVKQKCKKNVVGAMYQDFEGYLYGYDLNANGIWVTIDAYNFLLKYKFEIERLNYYAWAKKLESLNDDSMLTRLLDKLEDATPQRNNLSIYREILREEFEVSTCFYCGKKIRNEAAVDHVIPWRLVREDRIWNFVLSCKSCNSRKNDKIPEESLMRDITVRNEEFLKSVNPIIVEECKEYSHEMLMRLWSYAKLGGYKEYAR